jgi:hypothetical protein
VVLPKELFERWLSELIQKHNRSSLLAPPAALALTHHIAHKSIDALGLIDDCIVLDIPDQLKHLPFLLEVTPCTEASFLAWQVLEDGQLVGFVGPHLSDFLVVCVVFLER